MSLESYAHICYECQKITSGDCGKHGAFPQVNIAIPTSVSLVVCPVCRGCGFVPTGFYNQFGVSTANAFDDTTCRSCSGKGYIRV